MTRKRHDPSGKSPNLTCIGAHELSDASVSVVVASGAAESKRRQSLGACRLPGIEENLFGIRQRRFANMKGEDEQ